ncbi:hypothetical protein AKJ62_01625 [candidate division MSBL1 archaeon SCGC-AAA259D14]|uniref:Saccharopine dehydrogenase NADP binding domain-containing protein n=1 Tax=candidate division MSBL1 archaeon SCGC-AAA259D14 TaxID=1698261 RepID=A0A133U7I7_9EURY|nr:hypothetical protein AKJ62_01625 [candidate division MSBL1 archaeon SCGC-AAA259D14]
MEIVVLGCGSVGSGVTRDLVSEESRGIDKVIVSDSREEKAKQVKDELGDDRIDPKFCDVSDRGQTLELLDGADVCVNCVPTRAGYQIDIMKAALEAECPYLDIGGLYHTTLEQKKLHGDFAKEGVPAVLGWVRLLDRLMFLRVMVRKNLKKWKKWSYILSGRIWDRKARFLYLFIPYSLL